MPLKGRPLYLQRSHYPPALEWFLAFCAVMGVGFIAIIAMLLLMMAFGHAHGAAEWIQRGDYKNSVGELCCGERDCGLHVGGTIEHIAGQGYQVDADFRVGEGATATTYHVTEFVPESEATPSPDGSYWRCYWGGEAEVFLRAAGHHVIRAGGIRHSRRRRPMTVRAKFMVQSVNHLHSSAACAEITLRAVWGDGKGNESWSKATPQGEIKMMITNPAAVDQFDLGKSYYVDFTPAE